MLRACLRVKIKERAVGGKPPFLQCTIFIFTAALQEFGPVHTYFSRPGTEGPVCTFCVLY